jgi:6-phosphogluconolactonase (cycloisomerase 2 family)
MKLFLFLVVIQGLYSSPIEISKQPVAICYNPNSMFKKNHENAKQYVKNRSRFSTCTGVAWFHNGFQLISVNLLKSSFQTYIFNSQNNDLTPIQKWKSTKITQLSWPENLCFSKNGRWLAVTNSYTGNVTLYELNRQGELNPNPIQKISIGDAGLHGIRFSNNGDFLAYVTYENPPKIRIFRIEATTTNLKFNLIHTFLVSMDELSPKGIDFSPDDRYLAICFSKRASAKAASQSGLIAIYPFDTEIGSFNPIPICEIGTNEGLDIPEDLLFYPDGSCILASNQGNDSISIHTFDTQTGMINSNFVALQSPKAQLNFPHGISISPNGKYLAVSNYGDDKICIYKISNLLIRD